MIVGGNVSSPYDRRALHDINRWKTAAGWVSNRMDGPQAPLAQEELAIKGGALGEVVNRLINALTGVCNDAAQFSVWSQAILARYRREGFTQIQGLEDIRRLTLENVDKTIGPLALKYKGLALAEGVGAGAAGFLGLAVDIPAVITLNLRAIGEYATYYGFDVEHQEEKLYALYIFSLVSSPTDEAKSLTLAHLSSIGKAAVAKKAWSELEKSVMVNTIRRVANMLGIRLTKAKLAQAVPIIGAFIGGGYNVAFTANVCDAASHLYRERFLLAKYSTGQEGDSFLTINN